MPVVINEIEIIAAPEPEQPPRNDTQQQNLKETMAPRPEVLTRILSHQKQRIERVWAD
jgi:hypothetical protein